MDTCVSKFQSCLVETRHLAQILKRKEREGGEEERTSVWPANCNNAISILNNAPLSSCKSSFVLSFSFFFFFLSLDAPWPPRGGQAGSGGS